MVFIADLVKLPLTQFTLFPTLPVELRLKIWTIASFHSRNVDIWARCLGKIGSRLHPYTPFKYTSHCSVPAILHACRESREVGLQYYHLDFGTFYENGTFRFETLPKIYINFAVDRVCELSGSDNNSPVICEYFISKCSNNGAQSVALRLSSMLDGDSEPLLGYQDRPLWGSSTLEEVVLFVSREDLDMDGQIEFDEIKNFSKTDNETFILLDRAQVLLWRRFNENWNGRSPIVDQLKFRPRVKYAHILLDGDRC
jgi:hypothetical protein